MTERRWLRIIPVALIMYTIAYIDRTNISLALDPSISSMMKNLLMDDEMKGRLAGIFFAGYVLMQIPGGYLASHWSARKVIALSLLAWGVCAIGCGFAHNYRQFEWMRFCLGAAESAVFPAMLVLLANWFSRHERARANSLWLLCQPLAVAGSAPITGWLLGGWGWQRMLILEGLLPFIWLPVWWYYVRDHPRQVKWIPAAETQRLEATLAAEAGELAAAGQSSATSGVSFFPIFVMVALYFFHNSAVYGAMTFFTDGLKGRGFDGLEYGVLFAIPYAVTAVVMVMVSWHSDKKQERRGHVAAMYVMSGLSLIASVALHGHFWISYALMCLAIPGPFAAMSPFWAIPGETLPRRVMGVVMGLINACGNLGGFVGPYLVGWLKNQYHTTTIAFSALGVAMLFCAALAFLLPKCRPAGQPMAATA
jgi:MFS family permease